MAVTVGIYNVFPLDLASKVHDLDSDTLKLALLSAHTFDPVDEVFADVSGDQIAGSFGYTTGGATLGSVTLGEVGGVTTLDAANVSWTASGGDIAATDAVLYNDTPTSPADPLILGIDFGATEQADDGTDFVVQWHANGIVTLAEA